MRQKYDDELPLKRNNMLKFPAKVENIVECQWQNAC
jgi:hypothetical protein